MKRFASLLLVFCICLTFIGCGTKKRSPIQLTLSTEDSEAILAAAGIKLPDPETAVGANSVVKWYSWYDGFRNYSEEEIVQTGYYTFQKRYGGSIEWMECTYENRTTDLANYLLSGTPSDMSNCGTQNVATFPLNTVKGMYQPVDQWVDYENDPLWSGVKDAGDYYELDGKHFAIVYGLTFKDIVPYNRRVISEYGFDDPLELYNNDEWTWDNFYEMCLNFNDPDAGRYALDGWYIVCGIVEESTGRYILKRGDDGKYYSNIDDPVIEAGENLIYDLYKNDCFYHEGTNYWALSSHEYGQGVKDGNCLFWFCDKEGLMKPVEELKQTFGDTSQNEVMFVPLPRYQNGDGTYYLSAIPQAYNIINGAANPEGAVLLASCMRFKIIDPTVISIDEKQLREVYLWTDEMLDMWDHCNELVNNNVRVFQVGNLPTQLQDIYNGFDWGITRTANASTWAQLKEQYGDSFDYYIEELNGMMESYEYAPGVYNN